MVDLKRDELELEEAMGHAVTSMLKRVRTAMPAEVISFNEAQNTVNVQPLLQRKVKGIVGNQPPILDVPVHYYGAGGFVITHKPEAGDICLLVVTDRSLDAWKNKGGITDPADARSHDPTDSVAIFGINPFAAAYADIKGGIDVRSRDGDISLNVSVDGIVADVSGVLVAVRDDEVRMTVGGSVLLLNASGLYHNGKNIGATHVHSGVTPGLGNTGVPV